LVIVDDVDSLEGEDESEITFFDVTRTPSKVLFTSRRSLFGLAGVSTQVKGFSRDDGINTNLCKRIDGNVRRLAGELHISGKQRFEISEYIKHAATLMILERFAEAESVLLEGLGKYLDDPGILSQHGRTYTRWNSLRLIWSNITTTMGLKLLANHCTTLDNV
jgi:hypothetical protein